MWLEHLLFGVLSGRDARSSVHRHSAVRASISLFDIYGDAPPQERESSLIYFRMDARRGSDEEGSYLMVMTDEERAQRSSRRKETKRSSLTSLREIRGKARKQIEKIKSVIRSGCREARAERRRKCNESYFRNGRVRDCNFKSSKERE